MKNAPALLVLAVACVLATVIGVAWVVWAQAWIPHRHGGWYAARGMILGDPFRFECMVRYVGLASLATFALLQWGLRGRRLVPSVGFLASGAMASVVLVTPWSAEAGFWLAIPGVAAGFLAARRWAPGPSRSRRLGRCPWCDYDLRAQQRHAGASPTSCPECGRCDDSTPARQSGLRGTTAQPASYPVGDGPSR